MCKDSNDSVTRQPNLSTQALAGISAEPAAERIRSGSAQTTAPRALAAQGAGGPGTGTTSPQANAIPAHQD